MMEGPRLLKVKFGYNPNSSSHGAFFFIPLFISILSLPITLFSSLIFADILFRRTFGERKNLTKKVVFVFIPVVFLLGLYGLCIWMMGDISSYRPELPFILPLLLLISITLYIFTSYRTSGLISGLFVVIGTIMAFLEIGEIAKILEFLYIFGLIAGYLIDRKRMWKKDEGTF
jgi:hypothetical protein